MLNNVDPKTAAMRQVLKLSHDQIVNALTAFRAMDKTGDGSIDSDEFAQVVNMDVRDSMFQYLFNALDVDRSNSVNFKVIPNPNACAHLRIARRRVTRRASRFPSCSCSCSFP